MGTFSIATSGNLQIVSGTVSLRAREVRLSALTRVMSTSIWVRKRFCNGVAATGAEVVFHPCAIYG